jgi:SNF2 family DNA or RNA helicase
MSKKLLPHQIEDAQFLASKKFAGCFSGMGSGKTLTALEACKAVFSTGHTGPNAAIIIGPPISLFMWKEEFEAHLGRSAQIIKTGKTPIDHNADAWVMSYEIATKRKDELKQIGAKVLICDESHALKSVKAKRTKAILGRHGLCESVGHAWMLTGTPVTRWNDDIFSFMVRADNVALKEKIGKVDMQRFQLRYCITQKKTFSKFQKFPTVVTVGNRNTTELNELLFDGGMAVRRELADVWQVMPPLTVNRLQVRLDAGAELRSMLKGLEKQTMNQIQQDLANKEEHLATIRRRLGVAKVKHSVSEIVDRIEAGVRPILVGCWHTEVIDAIVVALNDAKIPNMVIDGRTSANNKKLAQERFNDGSIGVVVGQIAAMGVSLNMQGGSHIVCVEEDWSPAVMDQFYARCHRMGQTQHVHVDVFESGTKLDKAVRRITAAKRSGQSKIMEQAS